MKSGTSSLHQYLNTHPSVFMTTDPKEPSYFLTREQLLDVLPGVEKRGFWRSEQNYLALFDPSEDQPVVGEASANYARLPRVPGVVERIAAFNPEARIVLIMRDPVERTISHYWYMVRFFEEKRSLDQAVREDPDYVDTSHYSMQLEPYLNQFGSDNVKVLTTESLSAQPRETMSDLFAWLGVASEFVPPNLDERVNEAPDTIAQVRKHSFFHRVRHSRLWESVGPLVPPAFRRAARSLAERQVVRKTVDTAPTKAYLRNVHRPQVDALERLLNRDFPEWTSLHGDN